MWGNKQPAYTLIQQFASLHSHNVLTIIYISFQSSAKVLGTVLVLGKKAFQGILSHLKVRWLSIKNSLFLY